MAKTNRKEGKKFVFFKAFQFNSILLQILFVSIVLLILILCTVYFLFTQYYTNNYRESSIYFNEQSMRNFQETIDLQMEEKSGNVKRFFMISAVNRMIAAGKEYKNSNAIDTALALSQFVDEDNWMREAYLYIYDNDILVKSDETLMKAEDSEIAEILNVMDFSRQWNLILYQNQVYMYCNYPQKNPLATMILRMNEDAFIQILEQSATKEGTWPLYIYTKSGQAVFPDAYEYPFENSIRMEPIDNGDGISVYRQIEEPRLFIMAKQSSITDWTYVSVTTEEELLPKMFNIFKTVFPSLLFVLIIMCVFSFLLIRKIYNPLKRVIQSMTLYGHGNQLPRVNGNEFDFIQGVYMESVNENTQLYGLLTEVSLAVSEKLLMPIIKGESYNETEIINNLKRINSPMSAAGKYFLVALQWQYTEKNVTNPVEEEIYNSELKQWGVSWWAKKCHALCLSLGVQIKVFVLQYPPDMTAAQMKRDFSSFREAVRERCCHKNYLAATGMSRIGMGIQSLSEALDTAMYDLNRRKYYYNDFDVADYEISNSIDFQTRFQQNLKQLLNRQPEAKEDIMQMIDEVSQETWEKSVKIYQVLADIITEKLVSMQIDIQGIPKPPDLLSIAAKEEASQKEIALQVKDYISDGIQLILASGQKEKYHYIENARRYIIAHYSNSMLSLDTVSESLGISSPYLSSLFTRYLSVGFVEYLNRYRLNQARQLLEVTDITVSEIGLKTGFNSVQNFGRVFKKYYGKTPSEYREYARDRRMIDHEQ